MAELASGAHTLEGLAIHVPEATEANDTIAQWLGSLGPDTKSGQDETVIRITVEGEGQLRFEDGGITYCPGSNTAAIFYSQSERPDLTMRVYPIGKVTSDLSLFPGLPSRVEITFEVIKEDP